MRQQMLFYPAVPTYLWDLSVWTFLRKYTLINAIYVSHDTGSQSFTKNKDIRKLYTCKHRFCSCHVLGFHKTQSPSHDLSPITCCYSD